MKKFMRYNEEMKDSQNTQSGNALWFVMLGIVLLAALTMTITRSSDTVEQSGDFERYQIHATNILRYTKGLEQAIETMRMRGVSENDISFHSDDWGHTDYEHSPPQPSENRVFHKNGGGMALRDIHETSNWVIFGSHKVQDVETARNDLVIQAEVGRNLCLQINKLLDITNPGGDAPADDIDAADKFVGSFADASGSDIIIGDDAAELAGEAAGCRKDGTSYYYYHVLIGR